MADIFISYASVDRARVRPLAEALSAHGWSVWWDRDIRAGTTFDQVIADALANARCVVVVWSPQSVASDWVREEADEGRRRGVLIPVLIEGARPPLGFGRIQAVDLGDPVHASSSSAPFQKLVADITAIVGPPPTKSTTTAAAPLAAQQVSAQAPADPVAAAPVSVATGGTSFTGHHRNRLTWSLAAVLVLAILVFAVYRLGTGDERTSQPRATTGPSADSALRLNAVIAEGSTPLKNGVTYRVYLGAKDVEGTRKLVTESEAYKEAPRFTLPPGRYYVTATYGSASASTEVDVATGQITLQTLNLRAGILSLASVMAMGGKPLASGVRYEVFEAEQDVEGKRKSVAESESYKGPPRFPLPAGTYYVTAKYGNASVNADVRVAAGEIKVETMNLRAGILRLTAVLSQGGAPLPTGVRYEVFESARDVEGNRKLVTESEAYKEPPRFPLPEGSYFVTAKYGSASAHADVRVAAGDEPTREVLNLQAGILNLTSVPAAGGSPLQHGVKYQVFDAATDVEGNRKLVTESEAYKEPPRFPLPAGRYYVTATSNAGTGDSDVSISAGEMRQLQLRLVATPVSVKKR